MNARTAHIALGKAFCIRIEPTHHLIVRTDDNNSFVADDVTVFSYETYKQQEKLEPATLTLTEDSFAEMGLLYLDFLQNHQDDIQCSQQLITNIQTVFNQQHLQPYQTKRTLRNFMAKTIIEHHDDLIFANASDILSQSQPNRISFRNRLIKLVDGYQESKAKYGRILELFKTDGSVSIRQANPRAWAVEFMMDYEAQVIYSGFCGVFSKYNINLSAYYRRYQPMTEQQIKKDYTSARELEMLSAWSISYDFLHEAVERGDLRQALAIVMTMEVEKDSHFYRYYLQARQGVDALFDLKVFKRLCFFEINPSIKKEYDEIVERESIRLN